jgi:transcriptional regulator with XRE-family HTH domain
MESNKVSELSLLIEEYLLQNANVSINALAMRMGIAETTLRRIRGGLSKRLPNSENLLKIVFYIFKSRDLYVVRDLLPTALKEHFISVYLLFESGESNPVIEIDNSIIDNQITYLVLKLASNHSGVKRDEVLRLFGELGLRSIEKLILVEIVIEEEGTFKTNLNSFRLPDNSFINNFKSVADFIKIDPEKRVGPNIYHNLSESLNLDGLVRLQNIQKKAVQEMTTILNDTKFKGELPVFSLVAVDTIS